MCLGASQRGLRASQGDLCTDKTTELVPILQDFVPIAETRRDSERRKEKKKKRDRVSQRKREIY